jgi:hypothetical protein
MKRYPYGFLFQDVSGVSTQIASQSTLPSGIPSSGGDLIGTEYFKPVYPDPEKALTAHDSTKSCKPGSANCNFLCRLRASLKPDPSKI